jgi:hypothetical protein
LKTLKKAIDFELTDVILFCARYLRMHYSLKGEREHFNQYHSIVKQYHEILTAEDDCAGYIETINVMGVNSNVSRKEELEIASDFLIKATLLAAKYPTYNLTLNFFRIKGITEYMLQNYTESIKTWKHFDEFISGYKHFEYQNRMAESDLKKMDCYLQLRDFKNGSFCADNCDKLFKPFSNNWFIFKEYFLLLAFHTKNYDKAAQTIDKVVLNDQFKYQMSNRLEKWKIFEAYLYILLKAGLSKSPGAKTRLNSFKLSKFLNETPIYTKDKRGYNISILIIQILFLLLEKKYNDITDKFDALERYTYRYFGGDHTNRAYIFLKMILEVERSAFYREKTKSITDNMLISLSSNQDKYISDLEGLEIVPFTVLWDIVLSCLT